MDRGSFQFPASDKNAANRSDLVVKNERSVGVIEDRKRMVPSPARLTSDSLIAPKQPPETDHQIQSTISAYELEQIQGRRVTSRAMRKKPVRNSGRAPF
jgi:hypothetical protein